MVGDECISSRRDATDVIALSGSKYFSRKRAGIFVGRGLKLEKCKAHFENLIDRFEQETRKPTDGILRGIIIDALAPEALHSDWPVSTHRAGEWLVDALCLIPIQIAITRDNRFIPLRDGVWSPENERSMLGSTVNQIAGSLSFGWYESIFSYVDLVRPFLLDLAMC